MMDTLQSHSSQLDFPDNTLEIVWTGLVDDFG